MERNALLIYLRELRDLEIAHRRLQNMIAEEKEIYQKRYDNLNTITTYQIPVKENPVSVVGLIFLIPSTIFLFGPKYTEKLEYILGTIGVLIGVILCVVKYVEYSSYKKELENITKMNEDEERKFENNKIKCQQIINEWDGRYAFLKSESEKVGSLLEKYYAINVLPNQYRNLESLYYIYDYMSSSEATFEDTLIHEHMENGIQRILDKLDYIISQNQQIIFQNRIMEAKSQQLINNTNAIFESMERIEQDTGLALQYAQLTACYNEANAYFSLATYLNSKQ